MINHPIPLFQIFIFEKEKPIMPKNDMKTIFITGASSGIGLETAKLFSRKGWRVIATMRNPAKGTELAKMPNVVIMPLDVTDSAQIRDTSQKALQTWKHMERGAAWA